MKRSNLLLLGFCVVGFCLRLVALPLPILDDNNWLRQTQTASAAQSFLEHGFWPPSAIADWRGDLDAHIVQELPLYTWMAAGAGRVLGNLDVAGRLVSAFLWLGSFFILQRIWIRFLTSEETWWANALYVIAPLSVELGQAFLPEMLIQVLALGFLLAAVRYKEDPSGRRLFVAGVIGAVGACVKLPEIFHYYVLFGFLLWRMEGLRAALRLRYWIFAVFTLAVLKLWGGYVDAVNVTHFPDWTASASLRNFSADAAQLLRPRHYVKVAAYVTAFIVTPAGLPFAAIGLVALWRRKDWGSVPVLWLGATVLFYLAWGPATAMVHAYYNIPSLAPAAMVFGIGMAGVRAWSRGKGEKVFLAWKRCEIAVCALVIAGALGGSVYLLRPDPVVYPAAMWLRGHVPEGDLVLIKANHSDYTVNYGHLPGFSYYSGRRTWIWGGHLPDAERKRALETSQWLLVTKRAEEVAWYERVRRLVKRYRRPPEDVGWLTDRPDVQRVHASEGFDVYRLSPPHEAPAGS